MKYESSLNEHSHVSEVALVDATDLIQKPAMPGGTIAKRVEVNKTLNSAGKVEVTIEIEPYDCGFNMDLITDAFVQVSFLTNFMHATRC